MSTESDEKIIESFEGNYVADADFDSPSDDKDPWFPPEGLKLNLRAVKLPDGRLVAKISLELPSPDDPFQAKAAIEAAEYRVVGDKLCAVRLKVIGDVTADEILEMTKDGTMLHTVIFSDEKAVGRWTCPKPKKPNP